MNNDQSYKDRPLSPHLQIYKPQITSILSISHRFCGVFLSLGLLAMFVFVLLLAIGENCYSLWQYFSNSLIGEIVLMGWVLALFFHMFNGIRHLFWDYGLGLSLSVSKWTGLAVCAATIIVSIFIGIISLGLII
jgi:succinate dehydrogenase / fumarate reductase, cytochrome b subunit